MQRCGSIAGSALAILLMGVVLYFYGGDLKTVDLSNDALLPNLVGAAILYAIVVVMGAIAWKVLLSAFGASLPRWAAERQLLISQIGKYIPGNVAQYFGRAAMAVSSGVPMRIVGIAIVTETAGLLIGACVAVVVAIAVTPELAGGVIQLLPDGARIAWLGVGLIGFLVLLATLTLASKLAKRWAGFPPVDWKGLVVAVTLYAFGFVLLGASLQLLTIALSQAPVSLSLSIAVFAAAFVAGLATPGAPGGLGIRESIITLGLAPIVGGATALSLAILHRGASVLGDVISLAFGLALPRNKQS